MKWSLFTTGFNTGQFNMDYDIELAQKSNAGVFFRLYRWEPYCISLGANQTLNSINLKLIYEIVVYTHIRKSRNLKGGYFEKFNNHRTDLPDRYMAS